ncbi:DUF6745 domain-containing protein [Bradyrhizobium sp. HKCCYLS1011]|uniref:DUF6745 domain-containing protein n=1 Tax=Bradyrhizobium sp. HKCCYLS1011 TaxID=3420733 RepID=UPI003EBF03CF
MRASSPIETLSADQTAMLGRYRARWTAIRRSTEAADRDAAEEGVRLAYRAVGLEPPAHLIWCDGPVTLLREARRPSRADGPHVGSFIVGQLRRQTLAQIRSRIGRGLHAWIERQVNPVDPLVASAVDAVMQETTTESVSLLDQFRRSEPVSLTLALRALFSWREASAIGQQDLTWLGPCEYARNVLGLRDETAALSGLLQVAANAGWLQPHRQTCWLAERPALLRGDGQDRLHDAAGPALRYPDGWSVWAWKGVEVPTWIIMQPERITLAAIDEETNVQRRRCMIEIMTPRRYIALGGAARIAEDETGVLWRRIWPGTDAWAAVEVVNATPEVDGTHRHFFLQVPATMRTAREAVAWTYGLRPSAYAGLVART